MYGIQWRNAAPSKALHKHTTLKQQLSVHHTYEFAVRIITSPDEVVDDELVPVEKVTEPPSLLPLPPDRLT